MPSAEFPVELGGRQYNIGAFLRDHPGGTATLRAYRGRPVDAAMRRHHHSPAAYHLLNDFKHDHSTLKLSATGRIITKHEEARNPDEIAYLEELESRVDWGRALLPQLGALGADYERWVHSAVHRPCQVLAPPLLDRLLTRTPWYLVPAVWLPLILMLLLREINHHVLSRDATLSALQFCGAVGAGVLLWTLLEYALHRWLFHLDPGASTTLRKLHFLLHGVHHKVPFDGCRQVFPPLPAAALAALLYQPARLLAYPGPLLAGALAGYLAYDMIHYYVHHGRPAPGTYLYRMKRYHAAHHFQHHHKAFGISSRLWDVVFDTGVRLRNLGFHLYWD